MLNYIIVANGEFLVREKIVSAVKDKIIVALDGAADKLARIGIQPNIILGDFDSISNSQAWGITHTFNSMTDECKPYKNKNNITIVPAKDQSLTDLVKAIRYCDQQNAASISIICATGGRYDHHEAAVRALRSEYKKNRLMLIHDKQQSLRYVENETIEIIGKPGNKCGIIAFPHAITTTSGLKFEMNNHQLIFGKTDSIGNSLTNHIASIHIIGEALVIMPTNL